MEDKESLLLKWGTLKGWDVKSDKAMKLLREYHDIGASFSVAMQKDTPRQKEIICELIDVIDGPIENDWEGKEMTKEEAKEYVLNYGKKD